MVWDVSQKLTSKKHPLKTVFVTFTEFQVFMTSPYQRIRDMAVKPARVGDRAIYKTRAKSGGAPYFPPLPLHEPP